MENVKFNKSFEYTLTGLSINQGIGSGLVTVTDANKQKSLSYSIKNFVKERDLDLKISNSETKYIKRNLKSKRSKKRSATDCPPIKVTFCNSTTKKKKNEEVKFCNYFEHLNKFGFA